MGPVERAEYENAAGHVIGIVKIDRKGDEHGYALEPEERVWLSEEERRATARAPRDPADNPFANGWLRKVSESRVTDADDRPIEASEAPAEPAPPAEEPPPAPEAAQPPPPPAQQAPATSPGQPVAVAATGDTEEHAAAETPPEEHKETGAAVEPGGKPVEGEYGVHEEVATPDAAEQAAARDVARSPSGAAVKPPLVPTPGGHHKPQDQGD